ncbi:uncharacterized protein LOC110337811 [Mus pahari]|uniref:uncharacterized protein LOC110337811 n=1 Tax=Mus pahari TaxID=10093 RepID=UPI000A3075A1|nr:uncharacterized protein LOC110337811 [Mus pahari]
MPLGAVAPECAQLFAGRSRARPARLRHRSHRVKMSPSMLCAQPAARPSSWIKTAGRSEKDAQETLRGGARKTGEKKVKPLLRRFCRVGSWFLLVGFFFACAGTSPVRWISKPFFSFYFKCPLASTICAGCYVEGGRMKKEERNAPIALLIPEVLLSFFFSSFLTGVISS